MTDEAFHEKWYQFGPSVKRTFMLIILGNNLGCKLSMCDKFNLSLPSFMTVRLYFSIALNITILFESYINIIRVL